MAAYAGLCLRLRRGGGLALSILAGKVRPALTLSDQRIWTMMKQLLIASAAVAMLGVAACQKTEEKTVEAPAADAAAAPAADAAAASADAAASSAAAAADSAAAAAPAADAAAAPAAPAADAAAPAEKH